MRVAIPYFPWWESDLEERVHTESLSQLLVCNRCSLNVKFTSSGHRGMLACLIPATSWKFQQEGGGFAPAPVGMVPGYYDVK